MITFGLICEGPSEYRIIRYLTERYLGDEIAINPKQPEIKGGKQIGFGGWLNVLNYCTEANFDDILSTNDIFCIYNRLLLNILYVINQKYGLNL